MMRQNEKGHARTRRQGNPLVEESAQQVRIGVVSTVQGAMNEVVADQKIGGLG